MLIGLQKMIAETVSEERTGAAQGIAYFSNGFFMAAVTLAVRPALRPFRRRRVLVHDPDRARSGWC